MFIIGLPRSGTTLVEQILASHPQVHAAGELDALADLATATPDRVQRYDLSWPQTASELSGEHVSDIARAYLDRSAAPVGSAALRTVDKHPLNFRYLGLAALALPSARIIHCRRDIRDNALSIFAEDFTSEQRWATDIADIVHYGRNCRRIIDHWQEATELAFLDVDYEETVADLPGQARRLLDFLGLPWDPAVLDFHKVSRAIQTPSRWQVRQPIYTGSVGRWRRHAAELAPIFTAAMRAALDLPLRIVCVLVGGYALWSGGAVLLGVALRQTGLDRTDAMLVATMLGSLCYIGIIIWGFAARARWTAAAIIASGGIAAVTAAAWLAGSGNI